jgi:hypothetical protein
MALTDFTPSNGKIYYMTREQYEAAGSPAGDSNSLYFVQESTNINPNIVTMYAGTALVCELYDLTGVAYTQDPDTGDVLYDQQYRISGKMYLRHDDAITDDVTGDILRKETYTLLSYNKRDASDTGRFLECGITNNTIVCYGGKPDVSNCIKGFVYVVVADGEKGIYAFDGTNLVPAVTSSFIPDQFTILQDEQTGIVTGVGANVAGKTFTVGTSQITAQEGAIIFNEYDESTATNAPTGFNSVAFGKSNKLSGAYGLSFGYNNSISGVNIDPSQQGSSSYCGYNIAIGESNTTSAGKLRCNTISGLSNTVSGGTLEYNTIIGNNNSIGCSSLTYSRIHGSYNTVNGNTFPYMCIEGASNKVTTSSIGSGNSIIHGENCGYSAVSFSIIVGDDNRATTATDSATYVANSAIFGSSNTYKASIANSLIAGTQNTVNNGISGVFMMGQNNKAALSTDTGQGSTNSGVIGYANTIRYLENCLVVGDSNETNYSQSSLIVGYANGLNNLGPNLSLQKSIVVGEYNQAAGISYTAIFGNNNYGGTSQCSIISGEDNNVTNGHLCASVFGRGLQNSLNTTEALTVIGQYNISATPTLYDIPEYDDIYRKATFIVGNGKEVGNVITRSTSAILTYDGKLHLPSDGGNVITNNGNSIDSIRTSQNTIQTDNGVSEFTYLPKNGQEIIISTEHTVSSVQIDNISTMYYNRGFGVETKAVSSDYNSVIILKKGSIATAEDIMKNFTGADNTPMIYLLNKDIDISTFTILHVMLFNDGFNICAIVSGYEEVSNP